MASLRYLAGTSLGEKKNQVVFCVVKFLDSVPLPLPAVESSATRLTLWFCAPN